MSERLLAIDQGTTGTTCLVVEIGADQKPRVLGRGYREFPQHFPQPGWVEHDLQEIWDATLGAMEDVFAASGCRPEAIAGIGITNQRETTGVWNREGEPSYHALVWQDRRTSEQCEALKRAGHEARIRRQTGLVIDPYFSGTKLHWLLSHVDGLQERAKKRDVCFGTIDTWLVFKLTAGAAHITDATNASRTMLYDIHESRWDFDLCQILGDIPLGILPEVRSCAEVYGKTRGVPGLPDDIPIAGIAGDQHAALFGQACFEPGMAKCTYGTGAFALVNTGDQAIASNHGLLTTIAWRLGDTTHYALEGSAFIAGAIVQWLRDGLQFFKDSAEIENLAASVADTGGVTLVPALTGLGAPYWRPEARGLLCGLTRGTTRAHVARAALEGIALQIVDLLRAREQDYGAPIKLMRVDGGAAANDLLMQFQADLLDVQIHRPQILDTTALGAAYLAAFGIGLLTQPAQVTRHWALDKAYEPTMSRREADAHMQRWHKAVALA
ncbi:MAG: glycerol kinase GlpK [Myxococcota bacterium]